MVQRKVGVHAELSATSPRKNESSRDTKPSFQTEVLERSIEVSARHRLPIFLLGRSGSGKTHIARLIHERSGMQGNFVLVNCGRLPHDPAQLASELLGHVRGAFTGAVGDRTGLIRNADRGTLFLDEVESLPRVAQDFLIDLLEGTGALLPYGASAEFRVAPLQFRLISASKVSLAHSHLRVDLSHRLLAGDLMIIPTLEDRRADIPALVQSFLAEVHREQGIDAELSAEAICFLQQAQWPGQIRELQSAVRVAVNREYANQQLDGVRSQKTMVGVDAVRAYMDQRNAGLGVERYESETHCDNWMRRESRKRPMELSNDEVHEALRAHGGNKTRAALALGIALNTLKARVRAMAGAV